MHIALKLCLHLANMPGIPYSPSKRAAIADAALSSPYRAVAQRFGCSISTVSRLVHNRQERGHSYNAKRSGRPSSLNRHTLLMIKRTLRLHRFLSPKHIVPLLELSNIHISLSTLKRIMKKLGLKRRIARSKPFLTRKHRSQRRAYATERKDDSIWDHRRTIYTDEAAMRMNGTVQSWVTRGVGEAYLAECMVPKLLSEKKTCMVWAAIWHGGRTELLRFDTGASAGQRKGVTAVIYRDQVTMGPLKAAWNRVNTKYRAFGDARILEDNVKIHTSLTNRDQGAR